MSRITIIDHTGDNKECCTCKIHGSDILFFKNRWYCASCMPEETPQIKTAPTDKNPQAKRAKRGDLKEFIIEKFKELRTIEVKVLIEEAIKNNVTESRGSVNAIIFLLKKEGRIKPLDRGRYLWKG